MLKKTRCVQYSTPKDLKALKHYLGWYHKFISHFADIAAPLKNLKKKDVKWQWTPDCQASFDTIQLSLQNPPVLIQPDLNQPFQVHTDASKHLKERGSQLMCHIHYVGLSLTILLLKKRVWLWSGRWRSGNITWKGEDSMYTQSLSY